MKKTSRASEYLDELAFYAWHLAPHANSKASRQEPGDLMKRVGQEKREILSELRSEDAQDTRLPAWFTGKDR